MTCGELGSNKLVIGVAAGNGAGQEFFERTGFRTTIFEVMLRHQDHDQEWNIDCSGFGRNYWRSNGSEFAWILAVVS